MARNREPVKPVETQSEEDDEASSEEVDSQESDSEPEQTPMATQKKLQVPVKTQQPPRPPPPPQKQVTSSSDEGESGSETESDSDGPDPIVKPVVEAQKSSDGARKAISKPNAPEPVTPNKLSAAKRSAEDTATKDPKKSKKTAEPETSEKKPNLFQRLWTEDDEIVILRGMIDYSNKKKLDPVSDLDGFHDFIKKNLHTDFTRTQLQDKIRRLKKKYENNKGKEKEGKERAFSKPHEQNAYDLSKEIWGNETGKVNGGEKAVGSLKANGSVARKTPNKKANAAESEDVRDVKKTVVVGGEGEKSLPAKSLYSSSIGASMEERMLTNGREIYEMGQGLEGEKDWEKLRLEELQLYLKQLEVRVAQTKLVLNVMKGGDH